MTARGSFAIAALALHATLLPLPAAAQTNLVPSAVAPADQSSPLLSRTTATMAGLLFAGALLGDRGFREEAQERRGNTTNSVASVANSLGEWRFVIPALSAGYLAGRSWRKWWPSNRGPAPSRA